MCKSVRLRRPLRIWVYCSLNGIIRCSTVLGVIKVTGTSMDLGWLLGDHDWIKFLTRSQTSLNQTPLIRKHCNLKAFLGDQIQFSIHYHNCIKSIFWKTSNPGNFYWEVWTQVSSLTRFHNKVKIINCHMVFYFIIFHWFWGNFLHVLSLMKYFISSAYRNINGGFRKLISEYFARPQSHNMTAKSRILV